MADHLEEILTFLQTTLAAITGIGLVHTYTPIMTEPDQIPATMGASGSIHFWALGWEGTSEQRLTNIETELHHALLMKHYLEVNEPGTTEQPFRQLNRLVAGTLRGTYRVGVAGVDAELIGPVQTTAVGWRILGQTALVHYAELRLQAQELVRP